jgi:hypothetical protein
MGAGQFAIAALAPHVQGEKAAGLVDLAVVHPVSGPFQHFGPVCLHIDPV